MAIETNSISVVRKVVNNNVPGFDDAETGQNNWLKLYDFRCVDWSYAGTVKEYDLEHFSNTNTTGNREMAVFVITTAVQSIAPPYDIHNGDYVCFQQSTNIQYFRIVKINQTQMFHDCAIFEMYCGSFQPKEQGFPLSEGVLKTIKIVNGKVVPNE